MNESKDLAIPEESQVDSLRWGGKVLTGLVPIVGGGVAEIYDRYVPNGMQQRMHAWRELVVERLEQLELNLEQLQNDPRFASAMAQCSIDAIGQHDDEIVASLLNAIESAAVGGIDQSLEMLFLHYLRQFTSFHIQYLRAIRDNDPTPELRTKIRESVLGGNQELDVIIHEELEVGKGLITYKREPKGLKLSETGKLFMAFISSGVAENGT